VKNNVVGRGIGFQSQVMMRRGGRLDDVTNDAIERAWRRWCRKQHLHDLGQALVRGSSSARRGSMPTSGEILVRMVKQPFGGGKIPLALEIIESGPACRELLGRSRNENGNAGEDGRRAGRVEPSGRLLVLPEASWRPQFAGAAPSNEWVRYVPASEVLHLFIPTGPGSDARRAVVSYRYQAPSQYGRLRRGGNHRGARERLHHGIYPEPGRRPAPGGK
jgi:hypothetical protein